MTRRVVVVGAHASSGPSMHRYTRLLAGGWNEAGADVILSRPPSMLSRRQSSAARRKWLAYVEKFLIYPVALRRASRTTDIVHIGDHSDAILALVVPRRTRVVVTCHDLIAVRAASGELPEHRPRWTGRFYQRLVVRGLRRSDAVVAVSRVTASDVGRLVGRACTQIPNPMDPALTTGFGEHGVVGELPAGRYLLIVSSAGWRKQRDIAIAAWARVRQTDALADVGLVVVGAPPTRDELLILGGEVVGTVQFMTGVSDALLRQLYAGCTALILLSHYEGFGWPIAEAHWAGRPVLANDRPIFREVGGDGCVYVDSATVLSMSSQEWQAVATALCAESVREAATRNARRFAWELFPPALERVAGVLEERTLNGHSTVSA